MQKNSDERLIAGAMSGTSADGVDVAIVAVAGHGLEMTARLIGHHHLPYVTDLRQLIFQTRQNGSIRLDDLARMGREISLAYAKAANEALLTCRMTAGDLACVAAHGQTLFHQPPNTIQWFDPALVAAEVGCAVVSDFRRADCAAGGQGAPLVPFADYILFRHPTKNRVLLNIGGIANITWLKAGGAIEEVIAFDTGPGNCISDWLCRTRGPLGMTWDLEGQAAARGRIIHEIEDEFLTDPYFTKPFPKSTDTPSMLQLFEAALSRNESRERHLNDLLATAAYLTAETIYRAVSQLPAAPDELLASGGGVHNKTIMSWLGHKLGGHQRVHGLDQSEIPPDAKEAIAFALLGAATLDGIASNVPSVTGANRNVLLGSITPKP